MKRTCCHCELSQIILDRADPHDEMGAIEARDFLDTHLSKLTAKQRYAVLAWADGSTPSDIAAAEGITRQSAHQRLQEGLARLRELATAGRQ